MMPEEANFCYGCYEIQNCIVQIIEIVFCEFRVLGNNAPKKLCYQELVMRKRFAFAMCVGLIAVVWTVVLPWLGSRPAMSSHLRRLEAQKIDGGAMFYTELEAMEPILERRRNSLPMATH